MPPIGPAVTIPFVDERVEDGAFRPGEMHESAAEQALDELARTAVVVRRLRTATVMRRLRGERTDPALRTRRRPECLSPGAFPVC
jgi:hypothetical protein